jgi:ATP synthase B/B' CF(0)
MIRASGTICSDVVVEDKSRRADEAGGRCRAGILCGITLSAMSPGQEADQLAAQAADAVRRVLSEAESRAAEIIRDAETQAAKIRETAEVDASQARERAEADARAQIEAAKRALDELGGTLAAAASAAVPKAPATSSETEPESAPEPQKEPEPEAPAESPGAPETPVSPPADEPETPEPEQSAAAPENGDDAAERLVAMKLAVEGKDPAAIEAELIEKFGPGDRTELLKEILSRLPR